ncbi:protein of unknown function [Magnetospirillum sp. XM-1]|uniref:hypothetical protein n=1 Tax=Magnetospirillum sp. XM-1 TaxID=1663591 RepID=UPI00073E0722|nr:hypothetical protein [Magnetospirillum sp. XM-1]CUW41744.1 protein of unknown function [Magnetospirillum sp. XM-1]
MRRLALFAAILAGGLSSAAAAGSELACRSGEEALLTADPSSVNALDLAAATGTRRLELREWGICFSCAGMPALRLTLADRDSGEQAWISGGVTACGPADAPAAQRHCLTGAAVQLGNRQAGRCLFPPGTTLATLWTALTGSAPPDLRDGWWSYRSSAQ